jgi:hypothetical protein
MRSHHYSLLKSSLSSLALTAVVGSVLVACSDDPSYTRWGTSPGEAVAKKGSADGADDSVDAKDSLTLEKVSSRKPEMEISLSDAPTPEALLREFAGSNPYGSDGLINLGPDPVTGRNEMELKIIDKDGNAKAKVPFLGLGLSERLHKRAVEVFVSDWKMQSGLKFNLFKRFLEIQVLPAEVGGFGLSVDKAYVKASEELNSFLSVRTNRGQYPLDENGVDMFVAARLASAEPEVKHNPGAPGRDLRAVKDVPAAPAAPAKDMSAWKEVPANPPRDMKAWKDAPAAPAEEVKHNPGAPGRDMRAWKGDGKTAPKSDANRREMPRGTDDGRRYP